MSLTVYAEGMGLFHKGSGGKGVAPGDVCLTPPPPPGGPLPVPYVNLCSASDLSKGSSSVLIDGEPTALEDASEVSTSTGNEAGTQGGNVVTHKTKGKAVFSNWSHTVKIEGKGVCRHGDPMGQNCATPPVGIIEPAALVRVASAHGWDGSQPCRNRYKRPKEGKPNAKQRKKIAGKKCWKCKWRNATVPDHQPPLIVAWYLGGCNAVAKFKEWAKSTGATSKGHCRPCSGKQGGTVSRRHGTARVKAFLNKIK
ncbi:DUF4150 domain-containing protein [uncultured Variovorax sp.]|uniref:DUF4150 domain-containing protein n=1 Tax=uncultured Variovorax sp. TaxID=114708 RepID=UPI00260038F2|nr:DUF4150 domain-containing protein [uncultured Variovorax sp.]